MPIILHYILYYQQGAIAIVDYDSHSLAGTMYVYKQRD